MEVQTTHISTQKDIGYVSVIFKMTIFTFWYFVVLTDVQSSQFLNHPH